MTTVVVAMRDLDEALARAARYEIDAKNWRVKALQAEQRITDLESQIKLSDETTRELMRMVDGLRAERDTWRTQAGR